MTDARLNAGHLLSRIVRGVAGRTSDKLGWLTRHESTAESVTRRNTREAYDQLFGTPQLLSEYLAPGRLEWYTKVAELCTAFRPTRVVEVGCGSGQLLVELNRLLDDVVELVGVDHAPNAIARARDLLPGATWLVADLHELDLEPRFDLVLCCEVLEHLPEPERAVEALERLRAPNGRIVLTVPDGAADTWTGHVNFWTEDDLRKLLGPHRLRELRRVNGDLLAVLGP